MNKGGYTLVSLMLVNIALASFTVPGLGKRLHSIGRKRVVLTDINIAGERMKDIGVQVDLDTETETDEETGGEITHYKALIRDVYGYVLSVTDDTISSEQSKDPLELQEEIEDLQDKTEKITRSETATEVDGTLSADVIYGATSINSPSGAFDELNGESNPSVKPIYYHPITIWGKVNTSAVGDSVSLVALTNGSANFTMTSFIAWLKANNITYLAPASGSVYHNSERYIIAWLDIGYTDGEVSEIAIRGHGLQTGEVYLQVIRIPIATFTDNYNFSDNANKIN